MVSKKDSFQTGKDMYKTKLKIIQNDKSYQKKLAKKDILNQCNALYVKKENIDSCKDGVKYMDSKS